MQHRVADGVRPHAEDSCDHRLARSRRLERAVAEGLTHKMIFGSDGPGLHCGVEMARVKHLNLPKDHEAMVLGGTIAKLLGI